MSKTSGFGLFFRPVWILIKIFPIVIDFLRDWKRFVITGSPRVLNQKQDDARAVRLGILMGKLGPGFVKAAQVMSTRDDILRPNYTRELRKLQDDVPTFPTKQALKIIRDSTGKQAKEVFDHFPSKPIAAASLGQVYRAKYNGRDVAVKVLRPDVEKIVEKDLLVLNIIITLFEWFAPNHFVRSFRSIYNEYARIIREEMDFRNEEKNAKRLRDNFKNYPRIIIPKCFTELTGRRMVVFDFMEGYRVDDVENLEAIGLSSNELLELMITTYVRMTIVHGFIHADPHPGNLLIDKQKRLVILDYGMALEFPDYIKNVLLRGCLAVVRDDLNTLVDCFYELGMVDESANRALVRDAANQLLSIQMRDDFEPRMVQEIADDILSTFHEFPLRMPQQLVYLFRASALVEGIGIGYDSNFSAVREATPIVKKLIREIALEPEVPIREKAKNFANKTINFVDQVRRIIDRLEREEQHVRLNSADLRLINRTMSSTTRRLIFVYGILFLGATGLVISNIIGSVILAVLTLLICGTGLMVSFVLPMRR